MHGSLKSLQILDALSRAQKFIGVTALCEMTGLSAATVHRILKEMVGAGYAVRDPEQKKYRTGLKAMSMAVQIKISDYFIEVARSEMQRLNDLSFETIRLIALDGDEGVHLAQLEARNHVGLRSQVGIKFPLYCTGSGKAILAHCTRDWLYQYLLRVPLVRFTDNTLQNRDDFYRELAKIAEQGYSLDKGEYFPDIVSVAAPIFTAKDTVACSIAMVAPDYRFPLEQALSFAPEVMRSAREISRQLQKP
jgi:DNA-binding IclR family transcriptional regulator